MEEIIKIINSYKNIINFNNIVEKNKNDINILVNDIKNKLLLKYFNFNKLRTGNKKKHIDFYRNDKPIRYTKVTIDTNYIRQIIYKELFPNSNRFHFNMTTQDFQNYKERLQILKNKPKQQQGTNKWFKARKTALTASNTIKRNGSIRERNKIIIDKCSLNDVKSKISGDAIEHGNRFEETVLEIYKYLNKIKVYSFGVIKHDWLSWIAASPDSIDENGIMIEIKCIYSRYITGIIKKMYYEQIQQQLFVADLNLCRFIEADIRTYNNSKQYFEDYIKDQCKTKNNKIKGVLIEYIDKNNNKNYKNKIIEYKKLKQWISKKTHYLTNNKNIVSINIIYWYVNKYSCVDIYRDYEWITNALPSIYSLWNDVQTYKKNDKYLELIKNEELKTNPIDLNTCLITSDSDDNNPTCLISSSDSDNDNDNEKKSTFLLKPNC